VGGGGGGGRGEKKKEKLDNVIHQKLSSTVLWGTVNTVQPFKAKCLLYVLPTEFI
jgi:hypothetical protein